MMEEKDMKVLITGSNSGFGLLTALGFARAGHEVIATMRNPDRGGALRAAIAAETLPIEIRELDVSDADSVTRAIPDPGELDVLVNNAGFEVQAAMELVDDELLARQLDTNVRGPMRVMRRVLPVWRERGAGVVVNVSSIAGVVAVPYGGAYAASKHALEAITEALHYELAPLGLRFAFFDENAEAPAGHRGVRHQGAPDADVVGGASDRGAEPGHTRTRSAPREPHRQAARGEAAGELRTQVQDQVGGQDDGGARPKGAGPPAALDDLPVGAEAQAA